MQPVGAMTKEVYEAVLEASKNGELWGIRQS